MRSGDLRDRVAFDAELLTPDGHGGQSRTWAQQIECAAEFRYIKGAEAVQAGGLTGTATFKVRVRSCAASRAITPEHRMRDVRRGLVFNVREVDAITDPTSVWVVVENGVAV